jgi:hypothetical protein
MADGHSTAPDGAHAITYQKSPFPLPSQADERTARLLAGLERLEALRNEMTFRLVQLLDASEPDPDLEPGGDDEPCLSFTNVKHMAAGASQTDDLEIDCGGVGDKTDQSQYGNEAGLEGDGDCDAEHTLGWSANPGQLFTAHMGVGLTYGRGSNMIEVDDAEHDGREPSLGFLERPCSWASASGDQRDIGAGCRDDREEQCEGGGGDDACEDEGAACEDEGGQCDDEGHDSDREPDSDAEPDETPYCGHYAEDQRLMVSTTTFGTVLNTRVG